jgi:TRAP-type C4-dicarboxylate transport system permease small subunit
MELHSFMAGRGSGISNDMVFIGASTGVKKGAHVYFGIVKERLSPKVNRFCELFDIVSLFFFVFVGIIVMMRVLVTTTGKSSALHISYSWPKLAQLPQLSGYFDRNLLILHNSE